MANRNAEFYFQDIVFRVEDQLFKVPRRMFVQHSQVFRDMFDIPIPAGTEPDGCSDEQPLILETIEKKDFIPLLRCLYPPQFQRVTGHDFSLDEWKSVLKLANLYEMTDVKDFAVDCMTPLLDIGSPPVQIHLAQAHDVPKWLQPAKARLVDRSNPINENDVVEDQLFKVPRHVFVQHSQVFRDMFNIPIPAGTEPDGSSDKQPLTLETIEKKDFIPLLRCLYAPQFQRATGHDFSLDEWKSVLKLASLYEMTEVKDFAVDCMTPLLDIGSPSMQIHLAQVHDVPKWLQPAKARLVARSNPISENDVTLIGIALALEVCALRENALRENALRGNTFTISSSLSQLLVEGLDEEKCELAPAPHPGRKKPSRWLRS
ncbi:hypothetical protein JOM56_002868 [Amanita muscaria]